MWAGQSCAVCLLLYSLAECLIGSETDNGLQHFGGKSPFCGVRIREEGQVQSGSFSRRDPTSHLSRVDLAERNGNANVSTLNCYRKLSDYKVPTFRNKLFAEQYTRSRYASLLHLSNDSKAAEYFAKQDRTCYVAVLSNVTLFNSGHQYLNVVDTQYVYQDKYGCGVEQEENIRKEGSVSPLGRSILLVQKWSDEVYHFIVENLPRLALIRAAGLLHGNFSIIVSGQGQHVLRYLDLFGLSQVPLITVPQPKESFLVEELVLPMRMKCGFPFSPAVMFLRSWACEQHPSLLEYWNQASKSPTLLLIRRKGSRSIWNHDHLLAQLHLAWNGSVRLYHGNSLENVLNLFGSATVVMGPHGAGFSNMMFSRLGVGVVEFSHPISKKLNLCYRALAVHLQCKAYSLLSYKRRNGKWLVNISETVNQSLKVRELVLQHWLSRGKVERS